MGGEAQFNPLFQMLGLLGGGAGGSGFGGGGAPGPPVFTSTTAGRPVIGAAAGGGAGGGAGAMLPHPILQEILSNIVGMQFAEGMPPNIQIMAPEMQVKIPYPGH